MSAPAPTGEIPTTPAPRRGPIARLSASVADPVLRVLVFATLISRVGRGVFLTVTVLYFTFIVGLSASEVAIVLAATSAAGLVASLIGGQLADRFSARRLLIGFTAAGGVGLIGYVFAADFAGALTVAVFLGLVDAGANTARMAIIARAFQGPARVNARAVLRTVTNLAIAVGSGIGALALAFGTAEAYRIALAGAGLMFLAGLTQLVRLPAARTDAVATSTAPATDAGAASPSAAGSEAGSTDAAGADAVGLPPATVPSSAGAPPAGAAPDAGGAAPAGAGGAGGAPASGAASPTSRSPWRDPRYLVLTLLSAVFGMQFGVGEIAVPLWIAHDTSAPEVLVSAVLILNTIVVICFQVPLSRGTHDMRVAGRVSGIAAVLMAVACLVYAIAADGPIWWAVACIVAGALAHAFAEVLSQAGGWGMSFELADPVRAGAYQGVFSMGYSLGAMAAPLVVNATALSLGFAGWALLAAVFLVSGFGLAAIGVRAGRAALPVVE